MSLSEIVEAQTAGWFVLVQPVGALIFMFAVLAEVNRAPFDIPEAEQELTAGFHTEYSGMKFALFYMAEYQKMIAVSAIAAILFFGGYLGPGVDRWPLLGPLYMVAKIVIFLLVMVWVRATWPRFRYDRLMAFGWKVLLPLSLAVVFFTATGILLAAETGNALWYSVGIPGASILFTLIAVIILYRSLWSRYGKLARTSN